VQDDLNAFVMFETLNDRGLKVSQSDLLKNYLFGEAGDRIEEARERWAAMNGVLESLGSDDITMTYLRHQVISMYGYTREKEIYEKIRDAVVGRGPAIKFLGTLAEDVNDYAAIQVPTHAKWNTFGGNVRESLRTISALRVTPLRPLMLSVAKML